jgi:hypothetical protein
MRTFRTIHCLMVGVAMVLASTATSHAQGQPIAPEFRADILKLLEVTQVTEVSKQTVHILITEVMDRLSVGQPSLSEPARTRAEQLLTAKITTLWEGPQGLLQEEVVPVYAKYLSHEDVRALLDFYNTGPGKRLLAATPALGAALADRSTAWLEKHLTTLGDEVKAQLKAEGVK